MNPSTLPAQTPVLVTGATGFLGGYLAAELHRRGLSVRALARTTSDVSRLADLGVEIALGDVTDPASLSRAAHGQRVVFHCAAKVSDWAPREEFFNVNTGGTANVIAACQEASVERLIHVSSLTVLGLPRAGTKVDESSPYASLPLDSYTDSKVAAERMVREAHGQRSLSTTVVRPGVIWGQGDVTIIPRIADLLRRGRMVYIGGGKNMLGMTHVENLADGIILAAATPAAAGQVYHVTDGQELTAHQAVDALAAAIGASPPSLSLPFWAVHAIAGMLELGARATGQTTPPALTRYGVRLVACDCRYDLGKARRELGYEPVVSFEQGIRGLATGR